MTQPRTVLATALFILASAWGWVLYMTNRQVVSELTVVDPHGTAGRALVVYHPGLSDFQEHMIRSFTEGLVSRGWRVELTTASAKAPTDLSGYDLLLVGGPTYWWAPARPIQRYVARLGDLGGKPTAILVTGAGSVGRSRSIMERLVREANGEIVVSLSLTTMHPNDETAMRAGERNRVTAERMAREAAQRLPLPRPRQ